MSLFAPGTMAGYLKALIANQFDAALCMLDECITICPPEHWEGIIGKAAFWRVTYHTLFFVDMYLSSDESSFTPPGFHRNGVQDLGKNEASGAPSNEPYSKSMLADYVSHCREKVVETVAAESQSSLEKPSGFPWYPMSRGEHHLASIRHIQHHVGQLSAYLIKHTGQGVDWIGKR